MARTARQGDVAGTKTLFLYKITHLGDDTLITAN